MPYIGISPSQRLFDAQKDALKAAVGEKIRVLLGETEAGLLVDLPAFHPLYMAGTQCSLSAMPFCFVRPTRF